MPMHDAQHDPRPHPGGHRPPEQGKQPSPGLLSQSDPEPERSAGRPSIWLIVIVVLVFAGIIGMHLAGIGPSH
jgi:hypothetical protein